jgi:dienelactone hydrolase
MKIYQNLSIAMFGLLIFLNGCFGSHFIKTIDYVTDNEKTISSTIYKPSDDGIFPAVIILHGCSGVTKYTRLWASRIKEWGYVVMIVDSHLLRGISDNCYEKSKMHRYQPAIDAIYAKAFLSSLSFVDTENIGVIGFSQGGGAALKCSDTDFYTNYTEKPPFKCAIAVYPPCTISYVPNVLNANLLILIGKNDDWTPASWCEFRVPQIDNNGYKSELVVYPGAYHCYDHKGDKRFHGHRLKYSENATQDSISKIEQVLNSNLKK